MANDLRNVVRPVSTPAEWRDFHRLKSRIDRRDPVAVRPLNFQRRLQLDVAGNPFYRHAERAAFVAYRGGEPVGRICAIQDHLHQSTAGDRTGFFGFFECENDSAIAALLFDTASDWLAARGCDAVRGPVNPSMKSDFGVLVEGHSLPPYVMMAHNPPYYAGLLEQCSFEVVRTFLTFGLEKHVDRSAFAGQWEAYEQLAARIQHRYPQIQVRQANPRKMSSEIRQINELGDRVRRVNWGFVPFTPAELDHVVHQLQRVLRPDQVYLAHVGEQLVGYLMAMPDLNDALRHAYGPWDWVRLPQVAWGLRRTRRLRIFGLGIEPAYRHTGLLAMLIMRMFRDQGAPYHAWEFSWIDSVNQRSIAAVSRFVPLAISKRYHLYHRAIPPTTSLLAADAAAVREPGPTQP